MRRRVPFEYAADDGGVVTIDWKQKIEAQTAKLIEGEDQCPGCLADTMQALLDVAVAANEVNEAFYSHHPNYYQVHYTHADNLGAALDKLREVGDE